jgi:hypothetical protein
MRPAMKMFSPALAFIVLATPARGQDAVTFADLDGAAVEAKLVMHQVIRREGRQFPVRLHNHVRLSIGPEDKIEVVITPISDTPRGRRYGPSRKGTHKLEQPRSSQTLGGGHGVFVFMDGTLTWLRTFRGGAFKRTFAFARGAEGLTCTATDSFARESGRGRVFLDSSIDGRPVEVVSARQVASTCRVTHQKEPHATSATRDPP